MKIGLIVGTGTGSELAEVFCKFISEIRFLLNLNIEIEKHNYQLKTYWELRKLSWNEIEDKEKIDFEILWQYLLKFYKEGGRVIFRTAINAEVLYQIRKKGLAIKVFPMRLKDGRRILMIRDEMQGFYTNDEHHLSNELIRFIGSFRKDYFHIIFNYATQEASKYLGNDWEIWALYKFHLFANLIEKWFNEISDKIKVYQPDSGIDMLIKYIKNPEKYPKDILLLTGNEIGDLLCEFLMYILSMGNKDVLYSRDVFLEPDLFGLTIYQTIHGSADDIAGKNIVNPFATLRAAGDLIENWFKIDSFYSVLDGILEELKDKGITTPDLGGGKKTMEVVDYILERIKFYIGGSNEFKRNS
jgi:isocitrate/isopropylmalate dehydrogenase